VGFPRVLEHLDCCWLFVCFSAYESYLRTVCRVFSDFSDKWWWEKKLFNTKAMHNMDKIVQAIDTETGQVHTDEQVHMVCVIPALVLLSYSL
jgi:hypothetical protein